MGQQIGKPVQVEPGISPFVNLPNSVVLDFRCAVTEVSESGYSLCLQELQQIIQLCLHEYLTDEKIVGYANALFGLFNADAKQCDGGDEIDSFRFLGTLCIVSGMTLEQKAEFLFDLFDLNEKGEVNINEVTLAFRSLFYGTRKILVGDADNENNVNNVDEIDQVALEAFELVMPDNLKYSLAMANDMTDKKLSRQQFIDYIFNCPEAVSFLLKHDDIVIGEANNDNVTNHDCEQVERVINDVQSSTIQPWRDQLRLLKPDTSDERASPPPMDGLRIEHIHGRNSNTDTVYTSNGDIVYAAGSMVVKVVVDNDGRYQQEFFNEHSNRVSTIDIFRVNNEMGDMVASGEVSISNDCPCKVYVWSSATLSSLVTFQTIHKNGVSKLCFSPSGELLLAVGRSHNGEDTLIGVYEWRKRRLLFASKIQGSSFYDCSFLCSDNSFGICGDQEVHFFWSQAQPNESYRHYRGATNLFSSKDHMTSIACVGSAIVTGSASGTLWLWEGRVCIKRIQVFRSPITRLFADNVGLCVSTRDDGNIHLLGMDLELQRSIKPTKSRQKSLVIETLCRDLNQEKLLLSDSSDGIREIDLVKDLDEGSESQLVMRSRSTLTDFVIESLTCNIVTVGMDGFVTVWDKDDSHILQEHSLERKLSCVACKEHDGKEIAVGFYSDENGSSNKSNVAFVILCGDDVTKILHRGQNSQKTLTVCRYSSDHRFVAFGSEDSCIYIHSADDDYPLLAKARGHSSPILTFDFGHKKGSDTTSFLRSNSINGEALFWNTHGKTQTPMSQRHTCWESHTCIYSNTLEGAHDLYAQENNANITSCCPLATSNAQSIAVGDSRGQIRVFSYPALSKDCIYLKFQSHHGSVHKLTLSNDSLYTLGREDSCLCKWKVSSLSWPHTMPPSIDNDSVIIKDKRRDEPVARSIDLATATAQLEVLDFNIRNGNKESTSHKPIRPWLRSIVPPSSYRPRLGPLPDSSLLLERVHGYDGRIANNLHYLSSGDSIVYSVGRTLIRYDDHGSDQNFAHVDGGITCLALHKEKSLCAVGQDDHGIVIVDVKTMNYLCRIAAYDIRCLAFDESGSYLVVVDGKRLVVYNLDDDGSIISSTHTHATMTLDIKFTPKNSNELVECGMNYVRFWSIKGGELIFEDANMTTMESPTTFYSCIGWSGNDVLVGTSTGNVVRFAGKVPIDKVKMHTTKVTNISSASDGRFVVSSANHVKLYDAKMRCIIAIDTKVTLGVNDTISSLSWHAESRKMVIGTEGNQVWEMSSEDGSNIRTKEALINAPAASPMAISANPNGTTYATVGDDGNLCIWDAFNHDEYSSFDLTMPSRACAFSPDGKLLAVGFGKEVKDSAKTINGRLVIIDVNDSSGYRIIAERRDSRRHVREIKWHSSGHRLAVSTDNIYVYALKTDTNPAMKVDVSLIATIGITSPAIHFDFSKDGKYLRVNSEANELLWVEADSTIRIKEPSFLKDTEWESQTCVFDWNVQGVHLDGGFNVNSVDSYSSSVISGGDDGQLRLFSYPCTSTRANYLCYTGHNGPVASVRMLAGGSHLISTGVIDQAIMVWRHEVDDDPLVGAGQQEESAVIDTNDETDTNRCMAFYDSVDQIIFPSSGACVVLDSKRCTQQLFQSHNFPIGAIALSKSRRLVASGDSCNNSPVVRIWDPRTCTEIVELSDSRLQGVSLLAFSPDAKMLACVCSDENHKIFVWSTLNGSWNDSYLYTHALGGHEKINFIQMAKTHLITGGKTLNFWSYAPTLSVSKGVLSTDNNTEELLCGEIVGDDRLITGTSGGTFITWDVAKKKIVSECQAHAAAITALCACPEGLVSANSEGLITLWSSDMQKIQVFDTRSSSPIRSLDISPHSNGRSTVKILALDPLNCFEISCITGRVSKTFQFDDKNDVPTCKTEMGTHSNRIA